MAVNSNSGFNSPGFKEYDPTPYGGGYNLILTYGKPLTPSDSICHPSSSISNPDDSFSNGFSYSSIPNPYVNDIIVDFKTGNNPQPQNAYPPNRPQKEEEEKQQQGFGGDNGNWVYEPYRGYWGEEDLFSNGYGYGYGHESDYGRPVDSYLGEKGYSEKEGYSQSDFDCEPWSGYGYGRREDNCGYVGRQVPPPPGPDDPGPCAGLFGYFPCLSKKDQKLYTDHGGGDEQGCGNQWRGTAEYLFGGNLYPYGEKSRDEDVSYRYPSHAYERHYPEQPHYVQVDYNEQPHYVQVDYNEQPHYVQVEYNKQPNYVEVEYNGQPLFQNPGYYKAYEDKEYPLMNYGDDAYKNHQYFYYNQCEYTDE